MYKWTKKEMDYIESLIIKYKKVLKLQDWRIEFIFQNGEVADDENYKDVAVIDINISYLTATIEFKPFFIKRIQIDSKKIIKPTIKHELCHILTEPLYELACTSFKSAKELERIREQLTEKISKLI